MSCAAGPDVSESGLVLALDVGNYKNSRSSVSTNLVSNGSFANGVGSPNEGDSNPTNTIVQLENPGETPFVLRQNGNNTEYQLNIDSGMTASTTYVMSGWYAKSSDYNGSDVMFHARAFSSSGAHIATGVDAGTLIRSIALGSTTWEYRYQTIATPSDFSGAFDWYLGYGTNNTTGYRYYTNLKIEKGTFPSLLNMVGDSNHGTPTNGLSYSSANGGSLVFDGTNDYVNLNTSSFPSGSSPFSVNAFIKWNGDGTATNDIIFSYGLDGAHNAVILWINNSTYPELQFGSDTGKVTSSSAISTGVWYNICATYSGSQTKIYVNSELKGTTTYSSGNISLSNGVDGNNGAIGRFISPYSSQVTSPAGYGTFNGSISNVQLYNRALTASEISQNFQALRGRFGI